MGTSRRLLLAVVVVAAWIGGACSVVVLEVLRSSDWLCTTGGDGFVSCPDGISYAGAYLAVAAAAATAALCVGGFGVSRALDPSGRRVLAGDLAVLAALPAALLGALLVVIGFFGSLAASAYGLALVLPFGLVLLARAGGARWLMGTAVLLAAAAAAAVPWAGALSVVTLPGALVLLLAAVVGGRTAPAGEPLESQQSQD